MGKFVFATDRYILINIEEGVDGQIANTINICEGLNAGDYANVLTNALVAKAVSIGIERNELVAVMCDAVGSIYDKMMEDKNDE